MAHDELPLQDYDQLSINDLRHRVRSLDEARLRAVIDHERAHGNRTPVLELLTGRLDQLENGAEPAPGDPSQAPGVTGTSGSSPVQPSTAAEPTTPLRHGLSEQTPSRGRP